TNFVALLEIESACDLNLIAARKEFHFLHRRLDTNSLRRDFHRIDRVVEFDANGGLLQRMIECAEPLHLQRFGFTGGHHLQVRKWPPAFFAVTSTHMYM